ncbi:MAG: lipopolysaccharide biosynthesis protein [Candidatus Altiarchaeota archaeon]
MTDLKSTAVSGTFWMMSGTFMVRAVEFIVKIVLARMLLPEDFGLIAIGLLVVNTLGLFRNHEVGQALIYGKGGRRGADSAFVMQPAIASLLYAIIYLSAPVVSGFFQADVTLVVRVLALTLVIDSLGVVHASLLERDLRFKARMMPDVISTVSYAIVSLYLAWAGFGLWSIVWGYVASSLVRVVTMWSYSRWIPSLSFSMDSARSLLSYSMPLISANIILFANANLDDAIIGRMFGASILGYYTLAYMFGNIPATQITHVVGRVMFPVYSRMKSDVKSFRNAYVKKLSYVTLLSFPAGFLIMGLYKDFIILFIGSKWLPSVLLAWVLCLYGMVRSVGATTGSVFQAAGKPRLVAYYALIQLVSFTLLVFPSTIYVGALGVAIAATVSNVISVSASLKAVAGILKADYSRMLSVITVNFLISALPAFVFILPFDNAHASLMVKAVAYTLLFALLNHLLNRRMVEGLCSDLSPVFKHWF